VSTSSDTHGRPREWEVVVRAYLDGLVISSPALPVLIATAAVTIYLAGGQAISGVHSIALAGVVALIGWLILGALSQPFLTPSGANTYEYDQLRQRAEELWTRLDRQVPSDHLEAWLVAPDKQSLFSGRGLQWISGNGYLTLWTKIHAAEEALILVEPTEAVLAEANRDALRLKDSEIPQRNELLNSLGIAVRTLNPAAFQLHFGFLPGEPAKSDPSRSRDLARRMLKNVRQAINGYRQSMWDGLVRARIQFFKTLSATILLSALIVILLVARETDRRMVFVATVLFLVGSLVGLFARLRQLDAATNLEEDFGLNTAHLLGSPILSGIAAVLGVLLVGLAHVTVGSLPIGAPSGSAAGSSMSGVLSFGTNPGSLIIAALFGLTPEILIMYFQSQANQFTKGLATSETWGKSNAQQGGAPTPSSGRSDQTVPATP